MFAKLITTGAVGVLTSIILTPVGPKPPTYDETYAYPSETTTECASLRSAIPP